MAIELFAAVVATIADRWPGSMSWAFLRLGLQAAAKALLVSLPNSG
jgi:hypothetical protein